MFKEILFVSKAITTDVSLGLPSIWYTVAFIKFAIILFFKIFNHENKGLYTSYYTIYAIKSGRFYIIYGISG